MIDQLKRHPSRPCISPSFLAAQAYFCCAGAPDPFDPVEQALRIVDMALDMIEITRCARQLSGPRQALTDCASGLSPHLCGARQHPALAVSLVSVSLNGRPSARRRFRRTHDGQELEIRIGLHCGGPVCAGVVGSKMPHWSLVRRPWPPSSQKWRSFADRASAPLVASVAISDCVLLSV